MSLTKDDLKSIKSVVKTTVQPMLDNLVESMTISTAQGFAEVHQKIAKVDKKIDAVEENLSNQINNLSRQHDQTLDKTLINTTRITKLETAVNTK